MDGKKDNEIFFRAGFAGLTFGIGCQSPEMRDFCAGYPAHGSQGCDLSVTVTAQDIAEEAERYATPNADPLMYEISAVHRAIAEVMPLFNRLVVHGAAVTYRRDAFLFCAPSGTGKTTHISLWRRFLGADVDIINGDKPFLSLDNPDAAAGDRAFTVHGSPWAGKERWHKNRCAPLRAVCMLSRADTNSITLIQPTESLPMLLRQIYMPNNAEAASATLDLIDCLVRTVPVYSLKCNISEDAVRYSFEALTKIIN